MKRILLIPAFLLGLFASASPAINGKILKAAPDNPDSDSRCLFHTPEKIWLNAVDVWASKNQATLA